ALTRMAASKPQATICPRRVLNRSTIRLNLSKASKCFLPDVDLTCLVAAAFAAREGCEASAGAEVGGRPNGFGLSRRPTPAHHEPDEVVSPALVDENQTTRRGNQALGYPMRYFSRRPHVADQIIRALL